MHRLSIPHKYKHLIKNIPDVIIYDPGEPIATKGLPYFISDKSDTIIFEKLILVYLARKYSFLNILGLEESSVDLFNPRLDMNTYNFYNDCSQQLLDDNGKIYPLDFDTDNGLIDITLLENIGLLPSFITDIRECLERNYQSELRWTQGYNKKLQLCSGGMDFPEYADRTLLILDVSRSIPYSVVKLMGLLYASIQNMLKADVIITGMKSFFYPAEEAETIDFMEEASKADRSNESYMFYQILDKISNDYTTVVSFGDTDCPGGRTYPNHVQEVYHFFVTEVNRLDAYGHRPCNTGYAMWAVNAPVHHVSSSWIRWIKE